MQQRPVRCIVQPGSVLEALVRGRSHFDLPAGGNPAIHKGCGILNFTSAQHAAAESVMENEFVRAAVDWIEDGMPQPSGPSRSARLAGDVDPALQRQLARQARQLADEKKKRADIEEELVSLKSVVERLVSAQPQPAPTESASSKTTKS